jgi:hypothetical protein
VSNGGKAIVGRLRREAKPPKEKPRTQQNPTERPPKNTPPKSRRPILAKSKELMIYHPQDEDSPPTLLVLQVQPVL